MKGTIAYRVTLVLVPLALLAAIPLFAFPGGHTWSVDVWFTNWAHGLQTPALTAAMKWVSLIAYHNVQLWLTALVGIYFLVRRLRVLPGVALYVARWGGLWLSDHLKDIIARPRPQLAWVAKQSKSFSYPSGTVSVGAAFYVMLAYLIASEIENPRIRFTVQAAGWSFAAVIAFSRVYLGAHWLSDTVAGMCLAAAVTAGLSWALTVTLPRLSLVRALPVAASEMKKNKRK